ncbi:lytic transglycosylase domain-containing protein [Caldovatus aquaticus]|nr:lytic transglycosylase domain-containing protein [Caldovatus aquaticus]
MLRLSLGAVRPFLAVALVATVAVAGCGQQERPVSTARGGHHQRPASYDPPGPPHDPWGPWIREASRRFDVPETWIREVMRQESGGRASATSPAGAMGLMQVMPGTYRELQARYGLGDDPYHPYDNIMAGAAYIREMYDLFGSPAFLAAYNAGPRRLEDYLWNGRGLPAETRRYVARIGPRILDAAPVRRAPPEVYAAAEIPLNIPPGPRRMDATTMLALREQRQRIEAAAQLARANAAPAAAEPAAGTALAAAAPLAAPAAPREPEPPRRVASADPYSGLVVRMDPIPDGSTPEGTAALARARPERAEAGRDATAIAGLPVSPPTPPAAHAERSAPPPATRSLLAAARAAQPQQPAGRAATDATARSGANPPAAAPGAGTRPGAATQLAAAATPRGAPPSPWVRVPPAAVPVPPRPEPAGRGFSLMSRAEAATLPAARRGGAAAPAPAGEWGVQVGAFGSAAQAQSAASRARDMVRTLGARVVVQRVAQGHGTLYRARVTGLSRESASAACERLRRQGDCIVLSPDSI